MIAVPLRSGIKQECSPPEFVLNCVRGILASVLIQGKEMIGIQTGKEETQASVFESTEASVCKIQRQRQVLGRAWSSRNPHASWRGGKMLPPLWKTVWWFLIKLDIVSHHDTRFGIYLRDLKIYAHAKTRKCIFIAASFITASTMEEPR